MGNFYLSATYSVNDLFPGILPTDPHLPELGHPTREQDFRRVVHEGQEAMAANANFPRALGGPLSRPLHWPRPAFLGMCIISRLNLLTRPRRSYSGFRGRGLGHPYSFRDSLRASSLRCPTRTSAIASSSSSRHFHPTIPPNAHATPNLSTSNKSENAMCLLSATGLLLLRRRFSPRSALVLASQTQTACTSLPHENTNTSLLSTCTTHSTSSLISLPLSSGYLLSWVTTMSTCPYTKTARPTRQRHSSAYSTH